RQGRVGAVARGGRREAALAPFAPLWVDLKAGGELFTLRQVEPRGPSLALHGKALYCGFYVN
ncbi:MAG TPA: DNA repair protein RecO, partial [Alcanivorax sp.]|nr:DNA repair protein RecO [Alcanivorax sp.]